MKSGLSDQVRAMARTKYVEPAIHEGRRHFSIRVRDLMEALQANGFPRNHTPQVCNALQTEKFLRENGLQIESVEGPPSGTSTTVVVSYSVDSTRRPAKHGSAQQPRLKDEAPHDRAKRLTDRLRGLLKGELAAYGGGEAFLRWIRSEDEKTS